MTEFEGQIWLAQDEDNALLVCTVKRLKNKIQALNTKGREIRLSEEKLLWKYPTVARHADEWNQLNSGLEKAIENLAADVDITLLWESALELEVSEIQDLAEIYFSGKVSVEHFAAVWRKLSEDRLYFKRKSRAWEARSAEQVQELQLQREKELARLKEQSLAKEWLDKAAKYPLPPFFETEPNTPEFHLLSYPNELESFIEKLESWLRGDEQKWVDELVNTFANTANIAPRELVFDILQKIGRLPFDADRDVIVAGLKPEFPQAVIEAAHAIPPWSPDETQQITELFFSIDDEETREVDDALAIEQDGELWKVSIGIADPESVVHRGDVLDREAMRRGTTVYLPTQTVLMLPERISCDIASLSAEHVRSSIVVRAWVDARGGVVKSEIGREAIRVQQRLHYKDVDNLLDTGEDITAQRLRDLLNVAKLLQNQRILEGAFNLQRPEYKVAFKDNVVHVEMLDTQSPSRLLVAEMMILSNHLAAKYAQRHQVPIIYRTQEAPLEPIYPELLADLNPINFNRIRKLLRPSALSLQPSSHSGLGLSVYTQLSSPLRRFADLVMQRQLVAHVVGEPLPYDQDELYKVLATAERTAREARRAENEAKKRWFMLYLKQSWGDKPLQVFLIEAVKGGYKVEILPWGVDAFLGTSKILNIGETIWCLVDKIRVKAANARLKLIPRHT